ncbi:MAG: hypothetical protein A3A96_00895 [Candidatus Zambryskibacteria bacterium RIFCSPLOWO2_01_FULL_39_39]|uniref:Uncharacterized protein n=1 Tax=Candidatus Zambryskibacteria bacterium RIFCSPLOWO2_01_FULL_39_39 TaxID=1802758 RepID=A0A1G2TYN4_9BACT|nr:MAG: hypothetical protein UT00_C0001G0114 [Parcubacteria group bacterium GW2011_GWA1_38_7]OHA87571.1 MAG: hypothetical protein A2644_04495 [Candidatus Zambryskibacteria bacterium RIFCSPHIGHO2_01_FULL_39_63]OHA95098.1 MAG: hypothetical protein A3B88_03395 [Candidatus Zambryskibacteria bacterium RIFCSPHIGHO2_02_FULL_39_19]OHA98218.1 MAG: hypothetical protein A3F20_04210 [Candidatus Zambryskibacteria bacterium RIFCSPHIGHO2_12_FULL_39_21]OHB02416.1 MAG: hypothetical protein A3A96_00895 [Candidat
MLQNKPIHFYVANLGSEIQRIFVWKEKGDKEAMQNAYKRALSIIETIKNFDNKSANMEMDIISGSLVDLVSEREEHIDRVQMSSYFNPFALRVIGSI